MKRDVAQENAIACLNCDGVPKTDEHVGLVDVSAWRGLDGSGSTVPSAIRLTTHRKGIYMFRTSSKFASRLAIVSGAIVLALSTSAIAQTTSTGLGQSWPNATDVSLSPHYHVYVFVRDGVRYIQVNDANGTVRGAVATAGGQTLVLPIGTDASSVQVSQGNVSNAAASPATTTETVYSDSATQITATPQSNGVVALDVSDATSATCNGQDQQDCGRGTITY
jgi:hypothetical protein